MKLVCNSLSAFILYVQWLTGLLLSTRYVHKSSTSCRSPRLFLHAAQSAAYLPGSPSRLALVKLFLFRRKPWELSRKRLQPGRLQQPFYVWMRTCVIVALVVQLLISCTGVKLSLKVHYADFTYEDQLISHQEWYVVCERGCTICKVWGNPPQFILNIENVFFYYLSNLTWNQPQWGF